MDTEIKFQDVLKWSDVDCRAYLEHMRWPDGPHCPKCGANHPWSITRKSDTKNKVKSIYRCRECKKQYTATIGTIFEDSHIPLSTWFAAIYLMCGSKKGISAHQIHRTLNITYKSAWFMCHRIREAMQDEVLFSPLSGTIEEDETYVGGKTRGHWVWRERIKDEVNMGIRPKNTCPRKDKAVVFGILERDGRARTKHIPAINSAIARKMLNENVDIKNSRLITDANSAYRLIKNYIQHDMIDHAETYVKGDIHTQGIENYWSILKRGLYGVFHHVDAKYLENYLHEFEYRFNRRKITDAERFASLMGNTQGRVLLYCNTPQPQNPHA